MFGERREHVFGHHETFLLRGRKSTINPRQFIRRGEPGSALQRCIYLQGNTGKFFMGFVRSGLDLLHRFREDFCYHADSIARDAWPAHVLPSSKFPWSVSSL
jgi:hypothetical protein